MFEIMAALWLNLSMPLNILKEGDVEKHKYGIVYHLCFRNKELIKVWINCFMKALKDPVWNGLTWMGNTAQLLGYTLPATRIPENI